MDRSLSEKFESHAYAGGYEVYETYGQGTKKPASSNTFSANTRRPTVGGDDDGEASHSYGSSGHASFAGGRKPSATLPATHGRPQANKPSQTYGRVEELAHGRHGHPHSSFGARPQEEVGGEYGGGRHSGSGRRHEDVSGYQTYDGEEAELEQFSGYGRGRQQYGQQVDEEGSGYGRRRPDVEDDSSNMEGRFGRGGSEYQKYGYGEDEERAPEVSTFGSGRPGYERHGRNEDEEGGYGGHGSGYDNRGSQWSRSGHRRESGEEDEPRSFGRGRQHDYVDDLTEATSAVSFESQRSEGRGHRNHEDDDEEKRKRGHGHHGHHHH